MEYLYPKDSKVYDIAERVKTLLDAAEIMVEHNSTVSQNKIYNTLRVQYLELAKALDIDEEELSRRVIERKFLGLFSSLERVLIEITPDTRGCTMIVGESGGISLTTMPIPEKALNKKRTLSED